MNTINPYEAPQSSLSSTAQPPEAEGQVRPLLDAFIFENTDYYARFYSGFFQGNRALGFNWPAALFTAPWLAYRRMYAWAALYIVASTAFGILLALALSHLPPSGPLYGSVTVACLLGIRYAAGKLANYLYLSFAIRKINRISSTARNPEEQQNGIELAGGTSGLACTLVIVISGILNVISSQM